MPAGPRPDLDGSNTTRSRWRAGARRRFVGGGLLLLAGACTTSVPAEAADDPAPSAAAGSERFVAARPRPDLTVRPQPGRPADAAVPDDTAEPALSAADVELLGGLLTDAGTSAERRDQIASRLVALPGSPAREAVGRALRHPGGHAVTAILGALEAEPEVDPSLVDPLLSILTAADPPTRARLGRLLARLGPAAAGPASAMAVDAARPLRERLAAVDALASIATRPCGHALVALASATVADEPAAQRALRAAATVAFDRMVGRTFEDPADRRQWWAATSQRDNWWRSVLDHDRERIATLQASLDTLASRYVRLLRRTYADLNAAAITDEEVELLERHLVDDVREVRRFAIDRVERRLRDGLAIPDGLSGLVVARIDDPDATVRASAVRILDDLADPELVDAIAARLPAEPDEAVATVMLETLGRRGDATGAAAGAASLRLDAPGTEVAAARALIAISERSGLPEPTRIAVAAVARRRLAELEAPAPSPAAPGPGAGPGAVVAAGGPESAAVRDRTDRRLALLELLAADGDADDADRLVARLTRTAPEAETLAIARGLAARGDRGRLRAAARTVPAVAAVLTDALAADGSDLEAMEIVLELRPEDPDDPRRPSWDRAVDRIARGLSSDAVRTIDARLRDGEPPFDGLEPRIALSMRRRVLDAAVRVAIDAEAGRVDTAGLTGRLIDVLLASRDAVAARAVLERLDDAGLPDGTPAEDRRRLARLAFEVAVRTGHFDQADTALAAAGPDLDRPGAWIGVLRSIVGELQTDRRAGRLRPEDVEAADLVQDTIRERHASDLTPEATADLDTLAATVEALAAIASPEAAATAPTPVGADPDGAEPPGDDPTAGPRPGTGASDDPPPADPPPTRD